MVQRTAGVTTNPSIFLLSKLLTACWPLANHDPALPPNLFCSSNVGVLAFAGFISLPKSARTVEAYCVTATDTVWIAVTEIRFKRGEQCTTYLGEIDEVHRPLIFAQRQVVQDDPSRTADEIEKIDHRLTVLVLPFRYPLNQLSTYTSLVEGPERTLSIPTARETHSCVLLSSVSRSQATTWGSKKGSSSKPSSWLRILSITQAITYQRQRGSEWSRSTGSKFDCSPRA